MNDMKDLLKTTLEELEKVLSTRTVVGDPIEVGGRTLIPLSSIGFGFGAGGGEGKTPGESKAPEGGGAGTAGGGGIKPVAVLIVDEGGVRLESINTGAANVVEKLGGAIGKAFEKRAESPSSDA